MSHLKVSIILSISNYRVKYYQAMEEFTPHDSSKFCRTCHWFYSNWSSVNFCLTIKENCLFLLSILSKVSQMRQCNFFVHNARGVSFRSILNSVYRYDHFSDLRFTRRKSLISICKFWSPFLLLGEYNKSISYHIIYIIWIYMSNNLFELWVTQSI